MAVQFSNSTKLSAFQFNPAKAVQRFSGLSWGSANDFEAQLIKANRQDEFTKLDLEARHYSESSISPWPKSPGRALEIAHEKIKNPLVMDAVRHPAVTFRLSGDLVKAAESGSEAAVDLLLKHIPADEQRVALDFALHGVGYEGNDVGMFKYILIRLLNIPFDPKNVSHEGLNNQMVITHAVQGILAAATPRGYRTQEPNNPETRLEMIKLCHQLGINLEQNDRPDGTGCIHGGINNILPMLAPDFQKAVKETLELA